jgi:outer membrane receptor protein involved in Fe transport
VDGTPSNDFLHSQKGSARALWRPSPRTSLDVYAGGSWDTFGQATGFGNAAGSSPQGRFRSHFETARLSHSLDEDDVLELDLTRNEQVSAISPQVSGGPLSVRYYEYQLEALQSAGYLDDSMHTTWGGSFRYTVADSPDLFGTGTPLQVDRVVRGYVHQTARLSPRWTLIGGVSLESPYYLGTRHADYQAAALFQAAERHVLRASYSMAHTNPGFTDADINYQSIPGFVFVVPNPSLKSYELQNYELGWRGDLLENRLVLGSSLYYMKIRDHVNIENLNDQAGQIPNVPPIVFQYDNSNYLIGRGMELEGKLALSPGRTAYANYSLETVSDRDSHTVYIKTTPKHIVNLGFDAALFGGLRASANAGWKGGYLADSVSGTNQIWIDPFWRLDARLAYRATPSLEIFVSGLNLLTPRHVEFVDGLTVPRKYFGGVKVSF